MSTIHSEVEKSAGGDNQLIVEYKEWLQQLNENEERVCNLMAQKGTMANRQAEIDEKLEKTQEMVDQLFTLIRQQQPASMIAERTAALQHSPLGKAHLQSLNVENHEAPATSKVTQEEETLGKLCVADLEDEIARLKGLQCKYRDESEGALRDMNLLNQTMKSIADENSSLRRQKESLALELQKTHAEYVAQTGRLRQVMEERDSALSGIKDLEKRLNQDRHQPSIIASGGSSVGELEIPEHFGISSCLHASYTRGADAQPLGMASGVLARNHAVNLQQASHSHVAVPEAMRGFPVEGGQFASRARGPYSKLFNW